MRLNVSAMDIKEKIKSLVGEVREEAKVVKGEKAKDKVYTSARDLPDDASARTEFGLAKKRLFDVNRWSGIPGAANAGFHIHDESGRPLEKDQIEVGDFIKIDLPGPLPMYWVTVTTVVEEAERAFFAVRPSHDPTEPAQKEVTAHFFHDDAQSVFLVERNGQRLVAKEIGTDEAVNTREPEAGSQAVLNTVVSETGWAFFQKYQWKNLTDYLVGNE